MLSSLSCRTPLTLTPPPTPSPLVPDPPHPRPSKPCTFPTLWHPDPRAPDFRDCPTLVPSLDLDPPWHGLITWWWWAVHFHVTVSHDGGARPLRWRSVLVNQADWKCKACLLKGQEHILRFHCALVLHCHKLAKLSSDGSFGKNGFGFCTCEGLLNFFENTCEWLLMTITFVNFRLLCSLCKIFNNP